VSGYQLAFYLLAGVSVVAAVGVVTLRNVMYSALCLAVTLMGTAGIFVMTDAPFLAAVQVLLYAGGIMVLVVFAIMLIQRLTGDQHPQINEQWVVALGVCGSLGAVVTAPPMPEGVAHRLGELLLTKYLIPFEIASLVLLTAMIGAIVLAKRES